MRSPSSYTPEELQRIGREVVERLARSRARMRANGESVDMREEMQAARRLARPGEAHVSIGVPAFCPGCGLWIKKGVDANGVVIDFEREGRALGT